MVGILIATHGTMAEGLFNATQMICGEQEYFDYIGLKEGVDVDSFDDELMRKVSALNQGDGVIVLVDLMGATPMNKSAVLMSQSEDIEVITGVNLPMVFQILDQREFMTNKEEVISQAISETKESIVSVRSLI